METKGYIKISRQVLTMNIWSDPYDCRLYFFCLLRASHNKYRDLKPGQLYYSVQSLAAHLNWSRNSVAKHIQILSREGLIRTEHTSDGSVMTILRWEEISGDTILNPVEFSLESDAQQMCTNAQPLTLNAQQMCTPCTTVEHYQKRNQEEPKTLSLRERAFEEWWGQYPRHERKSDAKSLWMAMADVPAETLTLALKKAKQSSQWVEQNGRFIPSAAKWLDGKWEDYIDQESEVTPGWTEY